jgi:hypothetical protein
VPTAKDSRCRVGWRRNPWRTNSPARVRPQVHLGAVDSREAGRSAECVRAGTQVRPQGTSPVASVLRQRPDRCLGVPYRAAPSDM